MQSGIFTGRTLKSILETEKLALLPLQNQRSYCRILCFRVILTLQTNNNNYSSLPDFQLLKQIGNDIDIDTQNSAAVTSQQLDVASLIIF